MLERNDLIKHALRGKYNDENEKQLQKLLNERQIPFLPLKNDLKTRKSISCGAFGIVDLVRYQKRLYAHKRPRENNIEYVMNILNEAIKLSEITEYHPNIQRICFINLESLGFLMEYCNCGTLEAFIENKTTTYTLTDALNWAYQLADGLHFLHSINIMHRDIKIQNILLKDNYQQLILTDYGTATHLGRDFLTNQVGTPITMAPEVIRGNIYTEQCDIYSWAIVFWQLIAKKRNPYDMENMNSYTVMLKVSMENLRPRMLNNCPKIFVILMYRSWHSNPDERPSLSCIKIILRLLLKFLPKYEMNCSTEVIDEIKTQCTTDTKTLERYIPYQARLNNEKSKNLYEEHLKKLKTIYDMKQNISILNQQYQELHDQNQNKHDHYQRLLTENEQLREQIRTLNTSGNIQ